MSGEPPPYTTPSEDGEDDEDAIFAQALSMELVYALARTVAENFPSMSKWPAHRVHCVVHTTIMMLYARHLFLARGPTQALIDAENETVHRVNLSIVRKTINRLIEAEAAEARDAATEKAAMRPGDIH